MLIALTCQAQTRPNILFIAIDDMNDWTGFLGGHPQTQTPNMDRLAKKGVNFTNAHCSAPGCSPSRNALLYGVEPFHSGLYAFYDQEEFSEQVLEGYTSLPEFLKSWLISSRLPTSRFRLREYSHRSTPNSCVHKVCHRCENRHRARQSERHFGQRNNMISLVPPSRGTLPF